LAVEEGSLHQNRLLASFLQHEILPEAEKPFREALKNGHIS
jgi:hypothetical protein